MGIEQWWPSLEPSTRKWLIAHNGEPVPAHIVQEVRRVGGAAVAEVLRVAENGASEQFSDEAVDWIEAVANEEQPDTE